MSRGDADDRPAPAGMSVHHLCIVVGVGEADLRSWVANEWVRPRTSPRPTWRGYG